MAVNDRRGERAEVYRLVTWSMPIFQLTPNVSKDRYPSPGYLFVRVTYRHSWGLRGDWVKCCMRRVRGSSVRGRCCCLTLPQGGRWCSWVLLRGLSCMGDLTWTGLTFIRHPKPVHEYGVCLLSCPCTLTLPSLVRMPDHSNGASAECGLSPSHAVGSRLDGCSVSLAALRSLPVAAVMPSSPPHCRCSSSRRCRRRRPSRRSTLLRFRRHDVTHLWRLCPTVSRFLALSASARQGLQPTESRKVAKTEKPARSQQNDMG